MRSLSLVLIALALAAISALPARAAAPKPTIIVAVPVAFDYTEDKGQPDVKAASPTGARAHFVTPFYLGVGVASYKSAIKASSLPGLPGDLGTTYNLTELSANVTFGPVMLGYGYGAGTVSYSPQTQSTPIFPGVAFQVKRKDSPVVEHFITLGIYLRSLGESGQGQSHKNKRCSKTAESQSKSIITARPSGASITTGHAGSRARAFAQH